MPLAPICTNATNVHNYGLRSSLAHLIDRDAQEEIMISTPSAPGHPRTQKLNAATGILWILGIIGVWFGVLIGIHDLISRL